MQARSGCLGGNAFSRRSFPRLFEHVFFLTALLPLTLCAAPAHGQFGSSLSGTVLDPSGAAVPNATVIIHNLATQQARTVTTNSTGSYSFNELPPGDYDVEVSAPGFKRNQMSHIPLAAETPRSLNITLQAGGATETVTVSADQTSVLQTADASIGSTINSDVVQRLPLIGGDPYELLRTAPGITGDGARAGNGQAVFLPNAAGPGGSNAGIFQTENGVQIAADGQRQADNNYMVDGVSVNSLTHGGNAVVTPNQEAVAQMTVVSTSYDAGDGRNSGAQIKVVTKSGANTLHGSGLLIYDQPGLNSYNKWGGPTPGTLPVRVQNNQRTWADSLGGPIVKDKLFYFLSYQGFRQNNPTYTTAYVETPQYRAAVAAQRAGGVSAAILADPNSKPRIISTLAPNCVGFATANCKVVSGGIDVGSLTLGGASQLGVFPASTATGGGLDGVPDLQNVQVIVPGRGRGNQFNARGDWHITQNDLLAGSVYFTKLDTAGSSGTVGSRPQADVLFKPLNSAATAIWIHTFSPEWLNELRANGTRFAENGLNDAGNTVNFGIPYVNVQTYPFQLQYGVNWAQTTPAIFAENTYEIRDALTHSWGSHTIRAGVEIRMEQDNDNLNGAQRPLYAMQGLWTLANDAAVYEFIDANPNTGGPPLTQRYLRSQDYAGFVQHDWKVTPNLTLNTGLRWEMFTPLRNKGFNINYPVLGPAGSELTGMKLVPHDNLWNFAHNNWSPKVGFAWVPDGFKNKVVIRGGYALAYNHLDIALFNAAVEDGPNVASFNLCCAANSSSAGVKYAIGATRSPASFPTNPAVATGVNANGFPKPYGTGPVSVEVYGAPPNLKYPSSNLFSLETEYQLGWQTTATLGYAGSVGRHYARLVNQDFLYNNNNGSPVYAAYFAQTDSVQSYNGLNAQLRHTMQHGWAMSLVYTYSKALDQVSNGDLADASANQTNPAHNNTEYGPSDYDAHHRIVATALWDIPKVHLGNAVANALVNGWQANGTYTWHTGFPYTPVTPNLSTTALLPGSGTVNPTRPLAYYGGAGTSCSNNAFQTGSNFPNRTKGGMNVGGANYFNTTPVTGAVYTPGIGRNSFRGPCYQDVDISVAKEFAYEWGDHHSALRIQANMFNAFNILQLAPITNGNSNPGANINNQYFGYAQTADAGRVIEFLARFQF